MTKKGRNSIWVSLVLILGIVSCSQPAEPLPFLGNHDVVGSDTVYYTIPDFSFTNQNGETITREDLVGKVVVAEFFFTHCPTICPTMTSQMKRVQELTSSEDVLILAHTIDPERDTVERLKWYEEHNSIDAPNWHFLTGEEEVINRHGTEGYLVYAARKDDAPGGFAHSEFFILLDRNQHVRGFYDGTNTEEVDRLIAHVNQLTDNE